MWLQKKKTCVLGAVGTDVMPLQDNRREEEIGEFFRLMRRKFTDDEWCQIRSSGSDHKTQLSVFFRLWCLKESFIKARCFCNPKIRFFSLLAKNVRCYFFPLQPLNVRFVRTVCMTPNNVVFFDFKQLKQAWFLASEKKTQGKITQNSRKNLKLKKITQSFGIFEVNLWCKNVSFIVLLEELRMKVPKVQQKKQNYIQN